MDIGEKVQLTDGYTPSGKTRPWREAIITGASGDFITVIYCDTKERATVTAKAVRGWKL